MKNKVHPRSSSEARDQGFINDFACNNCGQIYCLTSPEKLYAFDEYKALGVISDTLMKCATILIETMDGVRGLRTDFWES
jgi:hypothetical protein